MTAAREEILARIRGALADVPPEERPQDVPVARDYRAAGDTTGEPLIALLEERLRDYHARTLRASPDTVADAVGQACREMSLARLAIPPRLPDAWRPRGVELTEDVGLSARELDAIDGALTGCAVAIAQTGTIALDASEVCGRRILTLVPDHHICVVEASQVVELVPEGIARLEEAVSSRRAPITLISGPSATSDIELERVEGVHGPRHLFAIIVEA